MASNSSAPVPPNITVSIPPTVAQLNYQIRHGIDPLPRAAPGFEDTFEYRTLQYIHETYQRSQLSGFTIAQLRTAGCLGNPDARPSDLPRVIHPLYDLRQWATESQETVNNDPKVTWDVRRNPSVRAAILPVLHLTTMIMTHIMPWAWFDALYEGDRRILPESECDDGCKNPHIANTSSFHLRGKPPSDAESAALSEVLNEFRTTIEMKIGTIPVPPSGYVLGRYNTNLLKNGLREIVLNKNLCFPLLQNDITVSERLAQQFSIAKVLCHETMHAFGHFLMLRGISAGDPRYRLYSAEPFFEDESMNELGLSWENATFGGNVSPIHSKSAAASETLALGGMVSEWPSWERWGDGKSVPSSRNRYRHHALYQGDNTFVSTLWPVPMIYIESLQTDAYWNWNVAKEGPAALLVPHVVGMVKSVTSPAGARRDQRWFLKSGQDFADLVTKKAGFATQFNISRQSTEAEIARLNTMMTTQVRGQMIQAELEREERELRVKRQGNLSRFEQRDYNQHQMMIERCKKLGTSIPEHLQQQWEMLHALRLARFPMIRCQANWILGQHPLSGDKEKRKVFLVMAAQEVAKLGQENPNDSDVARLQQWVIDAWNRILAEP